MPDPKVLVGLKRSGRLVAVTWYHVIAPSWCRLKTKYITKENTTDENYSSHMFVLFYIFGSSWRIRVFSKWTSDSMQKFTPRMKFPDLEPSIQGQTLGKWYILSNPLLIGWFVVFLKFYCVPIVFQTRPENLPKKFTNEPQTYPKHAPNISRTCPEHAPS